jgi:Fatty acid/phospholipid biosynthesis enzyme
MSSTRARIAIDAMGGDHAPAEIVAGALMAQEKWDVEVFLVGDPEQIQAALKHHHSSLPLSQIIPAEGTIEMHEEALGALKRKPKASINVAMNLVKQKKSRCCRLGRPFRCSHGLGLVAFGTSAGD